ncbi:MAG: hypothetical protein ABIT05_04240 [Chitinophagaceae bacterium]
MTTKKLLTGLLIILSLAGYSQDSARQKISVKINTELLGEWQGYPVNSAISSPALIRTNRANSSALPIGFDSVTDNPYRHGALYMAVKTLVQFREKLFLKADLYCEYRGFSYGSYHNNNRVLYPVLQLDARDTIRLAKKKLAVEGSVGQYLDVKEDEGIMIYNIDLQGASFKLGSGSYEFRYVIYADLFNSIGLNIDDFHSVSIRKYFTGRNSYLGFSYYSAAPPGTEHRFHSYYNLFGSVGLNNKNTFYVQASYLNLFTKNIYPDFKGVQKQLAFLAGVETRQTSKHIVFSNRLELRYYGMYYNLFHTDPALRYREPVTGWNGMYGNTTGKYLYPLRKSNTAFSQWAVFTEYAGYRIWAISDAGNLSVNADKKLGIELDYDINFIDARLDKIFYPEPGKTHSSFVYPFFKLAFNYFDVKELKASLFVSNRTMNLDIGYPTAYLLKRPFAGVSILFRI